MKVTIHRGTQEIGGVLIEIRSENTRILLDAGYPMFLDNEPIDDSIAKLDQVELLRLGVLPGVRGLYKGDTRGFDAVVITHAHQDHYGLLKYVHPDIPIYVSVGTEKVIGLSLLFGTVDSFPFAPCTFEHYKPFQIGDIQVTSFLMDHSAFDAAAFEIRVGNKVLIYSGDFRAHGRKPGCLPKFLAEATQNPDILLIEGTTIDRPDVASISEKELEDRLVNMVQATDKPVLLQTSSQNIDRLVTFYKAAMRLKRIFAIDVYTANVLRELKQLGNNLPHPSTDYDPIRVFFPYYLTNKIFKTIDAKYAQKFSPYKITKEEIQLSQKKIMMTVRPSMYTDIKSMKLNGGLFIYSLWPGYRDSPSQKRLESMLTQLGFQIELLHTSGHAGFEDIKKVIESLEPKRLVPLHTMNPTKFLSLFPQSELKQDGIEFGV